MKHWIYITEVFYKDTVLYYGGKHSTNNINDGYYGSGTILRRYVRSGYDHKTTFIKSFDDESESFLAEIRLIRELKNIHGKYCINVMEGGIGISKGYKFDPSVGKQRSERMTGKKWSEERKARLRPTLLRGKNHPNYGKCVGKSFVAGERSLFAGRKHTEDSKKLQSDIKKGSLNPMYGKISPRRGKPGTRTSECWKYESDIKQIWLENEKPSAYILRKIVVKMGFPDVKYNTMVEWFIKHG